MIEIRTSDIHGVGVFAERALQPGECVGVYEGQRYTARQASKQEWDEARTYLFQFADGSLIDGSVGGNATRHLNHSCAPNCAAYEERRGRRKVIVIYVICQIDAGTELSLDYCLAIDAAADPRIFQCACRAAACRGTMAELVAA